MVKEREVAGVAGGGERIFPDSQRGVPDGWMQSKSQLQEC